MSECANHGWAGESPLFYVGRWFLLVHAVCFMALVAMCGLVAGLELCGRTAATNLPRWLVPVGSALEVVVPLWMLGVGAFALFFMVHLRRTGAKVYSPEAFVRLLLILVPFYGLRRYAGPFEAVPQGAGTERPARRVLALGDLLRSGADICAVLLWPFAEGMLAGILIIHPHITVYWGDLLASGSLGVGLALAFVHCVVGLLALLIAERVSRGWERVGWFVLLLTLPPVGVPMLWFWRLRERTKP